MTPRASMPGCPKGYERDAVTLTTVARLTGTPSHGEPVHVGEGGIFCHRCEATGLTMGTRRAGFFPTTL
jgi:hypothetical protein